MFGQVRVGFKAAQKAAHTRATFWAALNVMPGQTMFYFCPDVGRDVGYVGQRYFAGQRVF